MRHTSMEMSNHRNDLDEESPLLQANSGSEELHSKKRLAISTAVVCTLLIGAVMSTKKTPFSGPQENTVTYKTFSNSLDSDGWYIYKVSVSKYSYVLYLVIFPNLYQVAYPGANGTTTELLKFMAMHRYICREIKKAILTRVTSLSMFK